MRLAANVIGGLLAIASLSGPPVTLQAQQVQTVRESTAVVPVVGNITGMFGMRWVTELALRNSAAAPVDVWLLLPTTAEAQAFNMTLAPGQSVLMRDVVSEAFGTTTALSPMKIITSGGPPVTAAVTIRAIAGDHVVTTQPVAVDYGSAFSVLRALPGLAFSDVQRTNIGLANLSETREAGFTLALQRIQGRSIAFTHLTVPPSSLVHTSIQSLFPMITKGEDFTVIVETADPETYVYASVIDNASSSARFVQAVFAASIDATGP